MGYVIAKYIRLSVEDAKSKSLSIENQHLQLDSFIAGLSLENVTVLEFVDNGYTGTNLERPRLQEMLSMVHAGRINCIVIKDFSRLARNVIDAGYFVEKVFPLFRVRLVALGDRYDSDEGMDDAASSMATAFQLVVNDMYSQDLSKKIRASKANRREKGLLVTKNCVFGYKLDADRKMVIDKVAADTVRLIFGMALQGISVAKIVCRLYVEQRPTAKAHKEHVQAGAQAGQLDCVWTAGTIYYILRNEQYTGMYIAGKTTPLEVGSKMSIKLDESQWVKIPDHHPAIVSVEDFRAVQGLIGRARKVGKNERKQRKSPPKADAPASILKGKVYCGSCGHKLRQGPAQGAVFYCMHTRNAPDSPCHRFSIGEKELEEKAFVIVQKRLQLAANHGIDLSEYGSEVQNKTPHTCADGMREIYEQLQASEIDAATYRELAAALGRENRRQKAVTAASAALVGQPAIDLDRVIQTAKTSSMLTKEIADALIERILIYPGGRIEVKWTTVLSESGQINMEGLAHVG